MLCPTYNVARRQSTFSKYDCSQIKGIFGLLYLYISSAGLETIPNVGDFHPIIPAPCPYVACLPACGLPWPVQLSHVDQQWWMTAHHCAGKWNCQSGINPQYEPLTQKWLDNWDWDPDPGTGKRDWRGVVFQDDKLFAFKTNSAHLVDNVICSVISRISVEHCFHIVAMISIILECIWFELAVNFLSSVCSKGSINNYFMNFSILPQTSIVSGLPV